MIYGSEWQFKNGVYLQLEVRVILGFLPADHQRYMAQQQPKSLGLPQFLPTITTLS